METRAFLFFLFLRFGLNAWGGPVAQIAMLREELVEKRRWVEPDKFRRALALYQTLPGPEAHELCVYFGMLRAGRWGGLLAGLGFMLPGLALMLILAHLYVTLGAQNLLPYLVGIAPAVTALIARAAHRIGQHMLHGAPLLFLGVTAAGMTVLGVHFLPVLLLSGAFYALWRSGRQRLAAYGWTLCAAAMAALAFVLPAPEPSAVSYSGGSLFMEGIKGGMLSFGGAYTAIPFLQHSMVGHYPHVTPQAFLDAIALGNVIPAPLVIFATFLGFLADGLTGALLITAGMFLPAFAFTLLGHRQLERMMDNPALHGFLDGVAAGVAGLLAITAAQIALVTLNSPLAIGLFSAALLCFYRLRGKFITPLVILACGAVGFGALLLF